MNYLTREEALEALNNGCHVSHTLFMSDEYIYKDGRGVLLDEDNNGLDYYDFFDQRSSKSWDTGWFIVNKSY
jgi:hypothetical protein